jgi:hypothetical protein
VKTKLSEVQAAVLLANIRLAQNVWKNERLEAREKFVNRMVATVPTATEAIKLYQSLITGIDADIKLRTEHTNEIMDIIRSQTETV